MGPRVISYLSSQAIGRDETQQLPLVQGCLREDTTRASIAPALGPFLRPSTGMYAGRTGVCEALFNREVGPHSALEMRRVVLHLHLHHLLFRLDDVTDQDVVSRL